MTGDGGIDDGRRTVLAAALASLLPGSGVARAHGVADLAPATAAADGSADTDVFPQGVASGGPTTTGAVCWTRVAPAVHTQGTPLQLTVADDADFADVVGSWRVPADRVADHDHTVKVDLDGRLDADSDYYYRFAYDGARSPVGRCRTLPEPDDSPDSLRLALATCQDYRNGYYGAYGHIADADVDFLLHLGDFIYEHGGGSDYDGRSLSLPSGSPVVMGVEDFRYLHRTYRSDRFLRAALAAHPLLPVWDDHEIVNNRYWDYEAGRPYAGAGDHPRNDDPEFMTRLFADGIRAWWEYMPTRVPYDPDADSLLDRITLWRRLRFGDLVDLFLTDERLYRTAPADGKQFGARLGDPGEELTETMLGERQREWFTAGLADSTATWSAWGNEVLVMPFDLDLGEATVLNADSWDAFPVERARILAAAAESDARLVALTGDMHTALAGRIEDPDRRYGVEFMTPAVTSQNLYELLDLEDTRRSRDALAELVRESNPHIDFFDSHDWGYAVVEFTPEGCTYSAYRVDKTTDAADASRALLARYRTPADGTGLERLE